MNFFVKSLEVTTYVGILGYFTYSINASESRMNAVLQHCSRIANQRDTNRSIIDDHNHQLEISRSTRLNEVCKTSMDGITKRWIEEANRSSFSSNQNIDARYSKMISELIEKCKSD